MAIHFDLERMNNVRETYAKWWRGELDRPLVRITLADAYPVEKRTHAPALSQANCTELNWSPDEIIDALDEELSRYEFLGDAFPMVNLDSFGPGVLSAFCGARLDNSSGSVWFFPNGEKEIGDIHVRYDPDNVWARRIKSLYKAGAARWNGRVVMGMPDLGGVMDVVAALRGSENLLLDLYDAPEEVQRVIGETQTAWYEAYADFRAAMGPQMGYSDWSGLLSSKPSYILQCDFCYMIGNPMFREFVLETLRRDVDRLDNTIYHLDGIGQLNHLDDVLALEKLNAVQWVSGAGQPDAIHWLDVYRRIQAAGKQMWIVGGPKDFLDVLAQVHGSPYFTYALSKKDRDFADALIRAR